MKKLSILFCLLFIVINAFSQKKANPTTVLKRTSMQWGVVSEADREMKIYPLDSSADAAVLDNYGEISISVEPEMVSYKTHKPIKLLKKSAVEFKGAVKILTTQLFIIVRKNLKSSAHELFILTIN